MGILGLYLRHCEFRPSLVVRTCGSYPHGPGSIPGAEPLRRQVERRTGRSILGRIPRVMQAQKAMVVPHKRRAPSSLVNTGLDRLKKDMRLTNAAAGDATNVIRTLHKADPRTGMGVNPHQYGEKRTPPQTGQTLKKMNRICYCDMVIEEFQLICMFLWVRIRNTIRKWQRFQRCFYPYP